MNSNPPKFTTRAASRCKRGWRLAAPLVLLAVTSVALPQTRGIALVGGMLIDGSGGEPVRDSVVLIRADRIEQVGTVRTLPIPDGYERISSEGMTVLPGLWDLHVHLIYSVHHDLGYWLRTYASEFQDVTMPAAARQMLRAGVTSVRDLAAPTDAIVAVRNRIKSGELAGPTLYAAGAAIVAGEGPNLPHAVRVLGAADAARKTRELAAAGMDVIKVNGAAGRPVEEIRAVVETAHSLGLRVTAHGRTDAEIRVGLEAGVDEFQHIGTETPELPADIVETIRLRIARGMPLYWSPTIGGEANKRRLATDFEYLEAPDNFVGLTKAMEDDIRKSLREFKAPQPSQDLLRTLQRKVRQLQELGVIFISGTDEGTFGQTPRDALWRDLDAWISDFGLQPMAAIKWVTGEAAAFMGVADEVGTIHRGKYADIIVVAGNPLEHIDALRHPVVVLKRGKKVN